MTIGGAPAVEHASLEVALTLLDSQMRLSIAANATDWLFVYAGVVALNDRALLVPGQTFTGKTMLVQALVQAGATYYSDEYAVLDDAGRVHPYPRPLSIRSSDGSPARQRRAGPAGTFASPDERATTAAVVITRYRAGVSCGRSDCRAIRAFLRRSPTRFPRKPSLRSRCGRLAGRLPAR